MAKLTIEEVVRKTVEAFPVPERPANAIAMKSWFDPEAETVQLKWLSYDDIYVHPCDDGEPHVD